MLSGLLVLFMGFSHSGHAEDDFGRLFSRPNERKNLDILRQNQPLKIVNPQDLIPQDDLPEDVPVALPDPIKLQGYVKRSDGKKSTLWINNQPVQEDSEVDQVSIGRLSRNANKADGLDVRIPANGKRLRLKAGQVYDPETNQIKELKTLEKEKQIYLEETGEINNEND